MRTPTLLLFIVLSSIASGQKDTLKHFGNRKFSFDVSVSSVVNEYYIRPLYNSDDHYFTNKFIYHFQDVISPKLAFNAGIIVRHQLSQHLSIRTGLALSDKGLKQTGLVIWKNNEYTDSMLAHPKRNYFLFLEIPATLQFSFNCLGKRSSAYFGPVVSGNIFRNVFNEPEQLRTANPYIIQSPSYDTPRFAIIYTGITSGFTMDLSCGKNNSISVGIQGKWLYSYFVPRAAGRAYAKGIYHGTIYAQNYLTLIPITLGFEFIYHLDHS